MKHGILALVCSILLIPAVVSADNLMRDYIAAPPGTLLSLFCCIITMSAATP